LAQATAVSVIETAARFIAARGEVMTLGRAAEVTTISLKGKRMPGALDDLGNTSAQQRFRVKIATAEIAASAWSNKVPARFDTLVVGGVTRIVDDVHPLINAGVVGLYILEVVG
jgi:hypothetical protein